MKIEYPIRDGIVCDWDLLEKVWDYALSNHLQTVLKDTPVLVTEKVYNFPANRQKYNNYYYY